MQNNTIAFTILKFPVLVRVQHNFTTVYSIFLRSPPKLGADILLFSLLRLSLLPPFNSLYFSKGTYVARLASWQIQTFSLVHFLRSKEPCAPHRKSLVFKSRIYHRCPLCQRYSEGQGHRASFVSSTLTIAITLQSLVPAGEEVRVCQDRGLSGFNRGPSSGRELWAVSGGFPLLAEEIAAGSG